MRTPKRWIIVAGILGLSAGFLLSLQETEAQETPPARTGLEGPSPAGRPIQDVEDFDRQIAAMDSIPQGLDIVVDVIGLEVGTDTAVDRQLAQVAAAAGGTYHSVQDARDLSQVFVQVTAGASPAAAPAGGGGMVIGTSRAVPWPLILGLFLLFGGVLAVLAVLVARSRGQAAAAPVYGRLDVYYEDGGTKTIALTRSRITIGRSPENTAVINDPVVSGQHAEIVISGGDYVLRDLGSSNGTFVNGRQVSEQALNAGDEIRVGSTRLMLNIS